MKACSKYRYLVTVLKAYLFVLACLLIELQWNLKVCCLYIFCFSKFGLPNWGLVYGCGLYMDFYGNGEQMRDNKVQIYNFKCVTVGG